MMNNLHEKATLKAYFIFILAASFYCYEMALQVAPSVMADSIMQSFQINAAGLGTLSAFYFYAFAPMQIPAGLLYDRYGPRLLMTLALIICATGALLFSMTTSIQMASLGRFMMGIGSAFSFIGVLLLIARWFPADYFAFMAGVTQLISSLGAMGGEFPLAHLALHQGWRNAIIILAIIGFILAFLVGCFVRDYPHFIHKSHRSSVRFQGKLKQLKQVLCNAQTVWIGLYAFVIWAPIAVFGALWSVPFLCTVYSVNKVTAAMGAAMIWMGVGLGSVLLGWVADKINNRRWPLIISAIMGVIVSSIILYYPISWSLMLFLLLLFGLAAGGQTLSFDLVKKNNIPENMGIASGVNNMAVLMGGALFQPFVGSLLVANWNHISINNAPLYSIIAYQKALWILPLCYAIAAVASIFFIKDK